jgi:hypothetical protein
MRNIKNIVVGVNLIILLPNFICAQSLEDFKYLGDPAFPSMYLSVSGSFAHVTNNEAPRPEIHNIKGWTGKLDLQKTNLNIGEVNYKFQHKLLGDMILLAKKVFDNSRNIYRNYSSSLTTGILGWHSWGWNINKSTKYKIAPGINLNDYFYARTYYSDTLGGSFHRASLEPHGYYWAAGPSVFINCYINKYIILQSLFSYSFSYWRVVPLGYGITENNYPKPHFFSSNVQVLSKWGFFISFDYNFAINRGWYPEATKRFDTNFGFSFVL